MVVTHNFTLDFCRADIQTNLTGFRTGDKDVHQLNPTYKSAGELWTPDEGVLIRFLAMLPDGQFVYAECAGTNIVLPSSVLASDGVVVAKFEISKDEQVLYAPAFTITVGVGQIGEEPIIASDDFSALQQATHDAEKARQSCVDEVAKIEQMLADGELVGPAGPQGETGAQGPRGLQGAAGPKGDTGARGETGPRGATGERGPQGEPGPKGNAGDTGPAGEAAEISGVTASATTLEAGDPATVSVVSGGTPQNREFVFEFGIPRGQQGEKGPKGDKGERGYTGPTGPQGPQGEMGQTGQAASIDQVTASVTTLEPGVDATADVTMSGTAENREFHFAFGIPKGAAGDPGESGVIVDGAVTTPKIADGAVTRAKLSDYVGLPSRCTCLNFLRSTGTQYIDTKIAPTLTKDTSGNVTSATHMYIRGQYAQSGGTGALLYFAGAGDALNLTNGAKNGILFGRNTDGSMRGVYSNRLGVFDSVGSGGVYAFDPHESGVDYLHNGVRKDRQTSLLAPIEQQSKTIYLFAVNVTSGSPNCCDCAIISRFSLGLWSNGTVATQLDLVPILDEYGVPCMYDIAVHGVEPSTRYYYNAGTGQFLYG